MEVVCSVCGVKRASVYQRHSGLKLCGDCLYGDVKARVLNQMSRYSMILPWERVLVGLSGGKDSFVLLNILAELHSPSRLVGLMIEEGIYGYNRDEVLEYMRSVCRDVGVECIKTSLKRELGYTVDDYMKHQLSSGREYIASACTYCGIARRRILNSYARMLGLDKVATGHNLDDEVQTYVINIMRGDFMRLLQLHPLSSVHSSKLVKRVKPLRMVYEYETTMLAYTMGYRFQEAECPYISTRPTLRVKVREMLISLEMRRPGAQLRFLEFIDTVLGTAVGTGVFKSVELPHCRQCGEPTSPNRDLCKFCELIDRMKMAQWLEISDQ
ncbi:MAG: adenine nucleotide alpha hydrolase family protein [Ignisphaera sp.]|nr:adenine nucleotide alpha hydrolase family protein [Ignisphaera sp.]MCX8168028.1 adenine nucleotide alpha hydrolase family protein [Ignisphaera sp.]MDW8085501.1 ATP-binding protein [Ignisphaera sp.]